MTLSKKYENEFLEKAFHGCINNRTEILDGEICGCYNCLHVSKVIEIKEWIEEPNGGEDSAACPNCTFDSVLSEKYPIEDPQFLLEMRNHHF